MNMPGTLAVRTHLIHERKHAPIEDRFPSEREADNHPEQCNRATVPVPFRRLAASQTARPGNAGPSGLRRGMGTVA
jgi:hypothetical protein